jgi:threonyl-tRNA synthetase
MHLAGGYDFVYSPHIGRSTLWETSGHLSFYKDGMFAPIEVEGQEYYLKPMNCPFHCKIYDSVPKSYRDLPKRFAEWGTVYRFERSGTLSGLTRVRGFTQDDAHLFCREDQMPAEIDEVLRFSVGLLRDFGLKDFHLYLSTRPPQRVGAEEKWDAAEAALKAALERSGLPFSLNEGDGAFYGPKIDICVKDTLDRQWQLSTIQFDFNLPERFDLSFTDADGTKKRPYMIHRALCGSIERFFAILVEHFGGAFPTWLAPVQVKIVPVNESCEPFANALSASLNRTGFRTEVDLAADSFNKKIRNAVTQKIPNILIVGNKEVETNSVTLRRYCVKEQVTLPVEAFQERLRKLVDTRLMDNDPTVQV